MKVKLVRFARRLGFDLVGIAPAGLVNERAPAGSRAEDNLPGAKSVVSLGLRMLDSIFESPNPRVARTSYTHLHRRLNELGWDVAAFLESAGFAAVPITSDVPIDMMEKRGLWGDISHRHVAALAGLGKIGRNQLLISPQFGPRLRVTSVVTRAPLEPDAELDFEPCAPGCRRCIEACPAHALSPDGVDKGACVRHMHRLNLYGLLRQVGRIIEADSVEEKKKLAFDRTLSEVYMSLRSGDPPCCIECVRVCPARHKGGKI